jgi:transcriptional regulator with XRE-family HTH domain
MIMARRFQPTWTQADYQKVKKLYHRHRLMTKVVDTIITSGLSYADIGHKAGVNPTTIHRWISGDTKNGKIDTIMSVLGALNMEMVLVRKEETRRGQRSEEEGNKTSRSEMGRPTQG